jgi:hypothetical protein
VNNLTIQASREHGGSIPIPRDPPSFVVNPWNKLICAHTTTVSATTEDFLLLSELRGQILGRVNLAVTSTSELEIRLMKIECWNLSGGDVTLSLLDPFIENTARSVVFERTDYAGRVGWACVGVRVPLYISQNAYKPNVGDTKQYCSIKTTGTSQSMHFRAHVLWKATTGGTDPTVQNNSTPNRGRR